MLYHVETGIPFKLNLPPTLALCYSRHAQKAAVTDRYGKIELQNTITTEKAQVIEVETDAEGNPIKILLRKPHDERTDVCLAIALQSPVRGAFVVKTVWLNLKSDQHKTLDRSAYQHAS